MAYTAPKTWAAGLVTASDFNTQIRDNLIAINAGHIELVSQGANDWMQSSSASQWSRVRPYSPYLAINVTPVGNVTTGEDSLQTYAVPANLLEVNGWGIEITAAILYGANDNSKQAKIYFGSTAVAIGLAGLWNGLGHLLRATVIRVAVGNQIAIGEAVNTSGAAGATATYSTPAETLTNSISVTVKGEGVDTDDVISKLLMVRFVRQPG